MTYLKWYFILTRGAIFLSILFDLLLIRIALRMENYNKSESFKSDLSMKITYFLSMELNIFNLLFEFLYKGLFVMLSLQECYASYIKNFLCKKEYAVFRLESCENRIITLKNKIERMKKSNEPESDIDYFKKQLSEAEAEKEIILILNKK